jgi:DNA-binding LacI/PurR family transcriptional regulator
LPGSEDVARLAGVSRKTVSRVFNDEPYVSAEARRRVLDAAERLGYRLNSAARSLASGRTRTIGVVTLGTAAYGPAALLVAIERAVRDAGYALRVVSTVHGDPSGVAGAVHSLLVQGVDGIVVSEPVDEGGLPVQVGVPVLFVGAPPVFAAVRTLTATVGAEALAFVATEHLLDLGHATVHHVAGPQRWFAARDRLAGWRAALVARGVTPPRVVRGDFSAASGYAAGQRLAADSRVTAVFAGGDEMAIGLLRALGEAGRRVPDEVSVVGFDDNPVSAYMTPPLTTVRQPFDAAAREGVRILVHAIEKPDAEPPPAVDPPVEMVVRLSTAPPPPRRHLGPRRSSSTSRRGPPGAAATTERRST